MSRKELTELQKQAYLEEGVPEEILSALNTLELAAAFHPEAKNKAVRKCLAVIAPRLHPLTRRALVRNVDNNLAYTGLIAFRNYLRRYAGHDL